MATYWLLFLTAAFLLNTSPGSDMIFLVTQTRTVTKVVRRENQRIYPCFLHVSIILYV